MVRNPTYQWAEARIENALLTRSDSLNLRCPPSGEQLSELPKSLRELTQLKLLDLSYNQLTELPEWLGELRWLMLLYLEFNQLKKLPESIGRLSQLQSLNISENSLIELPKCLGKLNRLETLRVTGNPLRQPPIVLGALPQITELFIEVESDQVANQIAPIPGLVSFGLRCPLKRVPPFLRKSIRLQSLDLRSCGLTSLPTWLPELTQLGNLNLQNNPLNPDLMAAYRTGTSEVFRYLRELAKGETRPRYEAKLLILGDGNEGKTCVSRALRNEPFIQPQETSGLDVVPWIFPHPDKPNDAKKKITLNIWDFEGQEISHQTHQFFLNSQALYLLVFRCRDQFLMDRAEYWFDTIRARAPQAKVILVITQCEDRAPTLPLDRIKAQYGDLLAKEWFFPVGCANGRNMERLQSVLCRSAADLPFMGDPWPKSYEQTEASLKAQAVTQEYITRTQLDSLLQTAEVSSDLHSHAAAALTRIGAITEFPDCLDLQDFVVLRPQWLTKAVSRIMRDPQLAGDQGEITFRRMDAIWTEARYPGMFSIFHSCLKEFELCYDLDDHHGTCLVPLRFGYEPPAIPWTEAPDLKERRMEYKLNIRPPMGLMSRFIVKTHHLIVQTDAHPKGVYWHHGVFLRTLSPCPSEALCEFIPEERTFRIRVRAAFPPAFCEQIHGYLQAVFSFFEGLSAERSYGCIKVDSKSGESACSGFHTEKRIYAAISRQRDKLDCEFEDHEVEPLRLIGGLESFGGFVESRLATVLRKELDRPPEWAAPFVRPFNSLLTWMEKNGPILAAIRHSQSEGTAAFRQEVELKLQQYLGLMSEMLDDRDHTAAPGLFSVTPKDRSAWNPAGYFTNTYILQPYCEGPGPLHCFPDGSVEFVRDRKWWGKAAPWIARTTKILAAGLPLAVAGAPLALGSEISATIDGDLKFMGALSKHLELQPPEDKGDAPAAIDAHTRAASQFTDRELALTRAALTRFLEDVAPDNYRSRRWGPLQRYRQSNNSYRWLCPECARKNPK